MEATVVQLFSCDGVTGQLSIARENTVLTTAKERTAR